MCFIKTFRGISLLVAGAALCSCAVGSESVVSIAPVSDLVPVGSLLGQLVPLLRQYQLLCTFHLEQQMAAFRATAKLLSVLLKIFTALVQKVGYRPLLPVADIVPQRWSSSGMWLLSCTCLWGSTC